MPKVLALFLEIQLKCSSMFCSLLSLIFCPASTILCCKSCFPGDIKPHAALSLKRKSAACAKQLCSPKVFMQKRDSPTFLCKVRRPKNTGSFCKNRAFSRSTVLHNKRNLSAFHKAPGVFSITRLRCYKLGFFRFLFLVCILLHATGTAPAAARSA